MSKISVVIPIYNTEPYIKRCLDSVMKQTYRNLEIICVNDGSTDNSGKICDDYLKLDNRITLYHQKIKTRTQLEILGWQIALANMFVLLIPMIG